MARSKAPEETFQMKDMQTGPSARKRPSISSTPEKQSVSKRTKPLNPTAVELGRELLFIGSDNRVKTINVLPGKELVKEYVHSASDPWVTNRGRTLTNATRVTRPQVHEILLTWRKKHGLPLRANDPNLKSMMENLLLSKTLSRTQQNETSRPTGIENGEPPEQVSFVSSNSTRKAVGYPVEDPATVCTSSDQNFPSNSRMDLANNASSALLVSASHSRTSSTAGAHSEDEILERTYLQTIDDCPSSPLTSIDSEEEATFSERVPATSEHTTGDNLTSNAAQVRLSDELVGSLSGGEVLSNEEPRLIEDIPGDIPVSAHSIVSGSASASGPRFGVLQLESEAVDTVPASSVQEERRSPTKSHEMETQDEAAIILLLKERLKKSEEERLKLSLEFRSYQDKVDANYVDLFKQIGNMYTVDDNFKDFKASVMASHEEDRKEFLATTSSLEEELRDVKRENLRKRQENSEGRQLLERAAKAEQRLLRLNEKVAEEKGEWDRERNELNEKLEQSNVSATERIRRIEEDVAQKTLQINELHEMLRSSEESVRDLEESLRKAGNSNDDLQAQVASLNGEKDRLTTAFSEAERLSGELAATRHELDMQAARFNDQRDKASSEALVAVEGLKADHANELLRVRGQVDSALQSEMSMKTQLGEAEQRHAEEVERWKGTLQSTAAEVEKLQEELVRRQREWDVQAARISNQHDEALSKARETVEELKTKHADELLRVRGQVDSTLRSEMKRRLGEAEQGHAEEVERLKDMLQSTAVEVEKLKEELFERQREWDEQAARSNDQRDKTLSKTQETVDELKIKHTNELLRARDQVDSALRSEMKRRLGEAEQRHAEEVERWKGTLQSTAAEVEKLQEELVRRQREWDVQAARISNQHDEALSKARETVDELKTKHADELLRVRGQVDSALQSEMSMKTQLGEAEQRHAEEVERWKGTLQSTAAEVEKLQEELVRRQREWDVQAARISNQHDEALSKARETVDELKTKHADELLRVRGQVDSTLRSEMKGRLGEAEQGHAEEVERLKDMLQSTAVEVEKLKEELFERQREWDEQATRSNDQRDKTLSKTQETVDELKIKHTNELLRVRDQVDSALRSEMKRRLGEAEQRHAEEVERLKDTLQSTSDEVEKLKEELFERQREWDEQAARISDKRDKASSEAREAVEGLKADHANELLQVRAQVNWTLQSEMSMKTQLGKADQRHADKPSKVRNQADSMLYQLRTTRVGELQPHKNQPTRGVQRGWDGGRDQADSEEREAVNTNHHPNKQLADIEHANPTGAAHVITRPVDEIGEERLHAQVSARGAESVDVDIAQLGDGNFEDANLVTDLSTALQEAMKVVTNVKNATRRLEAPLDQSKNSDPAILESPVESPVFKDRTYKNDQGESKFQREQDHVAPVNMPHRRRWVHETRSGGQIGSGKSLMPLAMAAECGEGKPWPWATSVTSVTGHSLIV
ncbi:hypothetical protein BC629DRAFT_1725254 [Irpex lacteus]|nr:hypothetical protein BC629DRAFT_1725254 [Irpex lacteus]